MKKYRYSGLIYIEGCIKTYNWVAVTTAKNKNAALNNFKKRYCKQQTGSYKYWTRVIAPGDLEELE